MHVWSAVVNYPHKLQLALAQYKKTYIIVSFGIEKQFTPHCVYLPVLENSKRSQTTEAYIPPHPCRWSCRGLEGLVTKRRNFKHICTSEPRPPSLLRGPEFTNYHSIELSSSLEFLKPIVQEYRQLKLRSNSG